MSGPESPNPNPDGGVAEAEEPEIVFSEAEDALAPCAPAPVEEGALPENLAPAGDFAPPDDLAPAGDFSAPQPEPGFKPQMHAPESQPAAASAAGDGLGAVLQIPITVEIVLGSARMTVSELAALAKGSKIPLDRKVGEAVDVVVNGRVIAHGSVIMLDDGTDRFGISLESLASQETQGS